MILKKYKSNVMVMLDYILYEHNKHELNIIKKFSLDNNIMFNIRPGNPKNMEETEETKRCFF